MTIKIKKTKYCLFDIEVMPNDLKIYVLQNDTPAVYDVKQLTVFMAMLNFILDCNGQTLFIGDYCTGFDIPILILIKEFYNMHAANFSPDRMSKMIIDFANDKTQKLIKYGCSTTNAKFESLKQNVIFCKNYIDVKFIMSTKTANTSLKHFQGSVLGEIKDFDFENTHYTQEELDKYGINDIRTSMQRFRHASTQNLYKTLLKISKKIDLYIVNFIPISIINYLWQNKFNINYYKCSAAKKDYKETSLINSTNNYDAAISLVLGDVTKKLNEGAQKQKIGLSFLDYKVDVEQFNISICHSQASIHKELKSVIKINLSEAIICNIIDICKHAGANKILDWILKHEIHKEYHISSKLIRAIYTMINNSADYKQIDIAVIQNLAKILNLILDLEKEEITALAIIENYLYISQVPKSKLETIKKILHTFNADVQYNLQKDEVFIYDAYSVINKSGIGTGIFDIEYRCFEKSPNYPSIASVKTFINQLLNKNIHTINPLDYVFVCGPCIIGLQEIKQRAVMLTYGNETLIINKASEYIKSKLRFQLYNPNIDISTIAHYYENEFKTYFT